MKPDIHPDYHEVLYQDMMTGDEWISRSTITSANTRELEGEEIPLIKLEISSYSHPFWTGHPHWTDPPPAGAPCAARLPRPSRKWELTGSTEPAEIRKRVVGRWIARTA